MSKKISNNPSFEKNKKDIEDMESVFTFLKLLVPFGGVKNEDIDKLKTEIDNLRKQMKDTGERMDKFNQFYSSRGWITTENMIADVADLAVEKAEEGKIEEGEDILVEYYNENILTDRIRWLVAVPELQKRVHYINKAKEDYLAERYYSCIPILLMMIDGATTDINQSRGFTNGFFSTKVDVTAWDSLAGHESGLLKLAELFNKGRLKTNDQKIIIPYRNGIMHGRELNYDNKIVAAKLWALLFAIRDWAVALKKKKPEEKPVKEQSIKESISELVHSINKVEEFKKFATNWKPRKIIIGDVIPKKGNSLDYREFTPERATVEFIELIQKRNYGEMNKRLNKLSKFGETEKEILVRLRKLFNDIKLIDFKFLEVKDLNFDTTEDIVELEFEYLKKKHFLKLSFRWDYLDDKGTSMALGQKDGTWYLMERNFYIVENFKKKITEEI